MLCSVVCSATGVCVQLNEMKRELLDTQQLLQEAGYERAQLQRRMEELSQRLADKSSSLDSSKKVGGLAWWLWLQCCI